MEQNQQIEVKFGDWMSEGFKMFTDRWQSWCMVSLLSLLITFVSVLCFGLGLLIVTGPIVHSLFYICFKQMRGEAIEAGDVMYGFKNRFWDFCKPSLLILGVAIGAYLAFFAIMIGSAFMAEQLNQPGLAIIGMIIFFVCIIGFVGFCFYLSPRLSFMFPLMVAKGYGARQAFTESSRVVKQKFWPLFFFTMVANLISSLGTYACYIGILATYPLFFTMIAVAYREIWERAPAAAETPAVITEIDPDKTILG